MRYTTNMRFSDLIQRRSSGTKPADSSKRRSLSETIFGAPKDGVDEKRRLLLRSLLFGGGAFIAYKSLSFLSDLVEGGIVNEHMFENFRVVETGKALTFFDRLSGDEILVLEKE